MIDSAELVLTVQQAERLDLLRQDATSKEIRLARIDMTRLAAGDPLDLGPAAARTVLLLQVRIERRDADDYSWFGENPETGATAALVVHGEEITGTIQAGQELYRIRSLGDGVHAVIEVDQEAFPPDHPPEFDDEPGNRLP